MACEMVKKEENEFFEWEEGPMICTRKFDVVTTFFLSNGMETGSPITTPDEMVDD